MAATLGVAQAAQAARPPPGCAADVHSAPVAAGPLRRPDPLKLHVPSPDWRDQVIYFVMTDRFADGDPGNNDQGAGEFKAGDGTRYNGGDFAGLRQRLDYVRGLGATALWVTPPVANQWIDPSGGYTGFHGYWAENFVQVDKHLGTLDDYRRLSDALHRCGMYLVQDIVVNHTGNYYSYGNRWRADDPAHGWQAHDRSPPVPRPSQSPFDRNDPRDPAQRLQGIYHWTPDVVDYQNPTQEHSWQMSALDDLNTENPEVRRALRQSYGYWIREAGVDAFRIDTAFYVPPDYFDDFLHARDPQAPGIAEVARRTGRRSFLTFGEGFGIDRAGQDAAMRKIESYMRDASGRRLLDGMLNFPLYGSLGDVFARGRPPAELGARITSVMKLHARPHWMPTFVDNHDVDRFLAGGSVPALKQSLLALMTLPGIPVIYYGTEQGYTEPRAAMFAAGFASGGRDRYDTTAPLYTAIAQMSALRRGQRVLTRGVPTVLAGQAAAPGALAWRMDLGAEKSSARQTALVIFNTADSETLLPQLQTGLPAGSVLQPLYGLDGLPQPLVVGPGGAVTLRLAPRAGLVWRATGRPSPSMRAQAGPTLDALPSVVATGDFAVSGRAQGLQQLQLVLDGDLAQASTVPVAPDGRWQAVVDTSRLVDPDVEHELTAWADGQPAAPVRHFRINRAWQLRADVEDPAGDDRGPGGRYSYPTDPGWGENRQMDLRRVRVHEAGGALKVELVMNKLTASWNPANGFDHVHFTVFIELPGRAGGERVMPLQNALLPDGMRWHLRLRAGGWSNALFGAEGASAQHEGRAMSPGAALQVDAARQTVTFTLPASALGRQPSLSGARIYVTTWDYDGGYRALGPQALPYAMGGGEADEPKVMDDSAVITLP